MSRIYIGVYWRPSSAWLHVTTLPTPLLENIVFILSVWRNWLASAHLNCKWRHSETDGATAPRRGMDAERSGNVASWVFLSKHRCYLLSGNYYCWSRYAGNAAHSLIYSIRDIYVSWSRQENIFCRNNEEAVFGRDSVFLHSQLIN